MCIGIGEAILHFKRPTVAPTFKLAYGRQHNQGGKQKTKGPDVPGRRRSAAEVQESYPEEC